MNHNELEALRGAAFRLGLELISLEGGTFGLIGNYRFVSRLCSDVGLSFGVPEKLKLQLELFASLDSLARSQFLLGIGVASDI